MYVLEGGTLTSENHPGQSVVIPPSGGDFIAIRFNWMRGMVGGGTRPTAFGTLYSLSEEFLGLPAELTPLTPGFIARSLRIVDNQYEFHGAVMLRAPA